VRDFRPREPDLTQRLVRQGEQRRGLQRAGQRVQPAPDRRGGLVADLLADDRLQQPRKAARPDTPRQRTGRRLNAREVGVEADKPVECRAVGGGRGDKHRQRLARPARRLTHRS